ncbi:MAG: DNA repair protein RecO C-terminal domain-containing protein [Acidimicrobiales bacterium]
MVDHCVSCGATEDLVAFDEDAGGVLCRSCRRGGAISPDALSLLQRILGGQLGSALSEPPGPASHEVEVLATRLLEHHLERRLRSVDVGLAG